MSRKNIGGDGRIGSGSKMQVDMHDFGRSTHNLSKAFRSTMSTGTLVPAYVNMGLNGDYWKLNMSSIVRTLPTIGPLFGSFKFQCDVFTYDVRLANAQLHNNALNIGRNMEKVLFPQMVLKPGALTEDYEGINLNEENISSSSLLAYLGVRGLNPNGSEQKFNAMPMIAYWDIYKNYYANKQEEVGYVLQPNGDLIYPTDAKISMLTMDGTTQDPYYKDYELFREDQDTPDEFKFTSSPWVISFISVEEIKTLEGIKVGYDVVEFNLTDIYTDAYIMYTTYDPSLNGYITKIYLGGAQSNHSDEMKMYEYDFKSKGTMYCPFYFPTAFRTFSTVALREFDLENIDDMRTKILQKTYETPLELTSAEEYPYYASLGTFTNDGRTILNSYCTGTGLGIKTYQSDRFNNWINTEWIDGENGVNEITAIDTTTGKFTMDTLLLQKKIFNLLNRIAMSGGSYDDWQEAVYGQYAKGKSESAVYRGGYSSEIVFGEVVSTAATEEYPLGTLGGHGNQKGDKGGFVEIKCEEACIIMVLVSITPRINYSQGNKFYNKLETMNDLHMPGLDGIGFQDLMAEEAVAWMNESDMSMGKQTAWIEWQTDVDECFGGFAEENNMMYMVLNRRYEAKYNADDKSVTFEDPTTYIDPSKHNYAFAQTSLDSQNFWVHVGFDIKCRRIMSAKEMPNL